MAINRKDLPVSGDELAAPAALKEWAVTVRALEQGRQIVVLRKGGIAEETRKFQLESPDFYLMPAYEHQRRELLKEQAQGLLDEVLGEWDGPEASRIVISSRAHAAEDILVTEPEALERIRGLHIWTDDFAMERLKWKRRDPLHVLLLRVYRLPQPIELPMEPAFTGCKSWISAGPPLSADGAVPVLDDAEFERRCAEIRNLLGTAGEH
ncbi:DUF1802 family protein [Paenibacillus pasadenensis]|uniref:DUF1802 family protein n=1 Tax=Paenibacillus pasadenensis TaxID=217090 RepID=UPI00203D1D7E|nr:DUF1802 family protein [Paenibacillus pasadenensis]MCM3748047.1 DUF1802 family protein [Paenibacillus pasadenensis]